VTAVLTPACASLSLLSLGAWAGSVPRQPQDGSEALPVGSEIGQAQAARLLDINPGVQPELPTCLYLFSKAHCEQFQPGVWPRLVQVIQQYHSTLLLNAAYCWSCLQVASSPD
jgi:hypothetical protein